MKIHGKHALVTGASSGIGRAIAIALAEKGARLTLSGRDETRLDATASDCRALGAHASIRTADVTDEQSCSTMIARSVEELGPVELLVSAAGYGTLGPIETVDGSAIRGMLETNFLGAVHCTLPLLGSMRERRQGALVYVSSILGVMATAGMAGYAASKFALNGWVEGLRDEVIDDGLFVGLICPGTTETAFFEKADRSSIPGASALLPSLQPEDVADATIRAIEAERWRTILPLQARLFMRLSEIAPLTAHFLMRKVSSFFSRRSS